MPSQVKKQSFIDRMLERIDNFQRRHPVVAFPHAIVKKYSDDLGGYQSAILTYFGFLSLFPLLIVATSIITEVARNNSELRARLTEAITSFFPAIGSSLQETINIPSRTGVALVLSLLVALYGARGIANAFQHALAELWEIPRVTRPGFPKSLIKSIALILGGGGGLMLSAVLSGAAAASSAPLLVRFFVGIAGFCVLFGVITLLFTYGSTAKKGHTAHLPGARWLQRSVLLCCRYSGRQ